MKNIVFIGSHLGYPMDRVPLGGGAMVGLQMARHWANSPDFKLTALGSGPLPPAEGMEYVRLAPPKRELVRLSELGYAKFCGEFSSESVDFLKQRRCSLPPENTCVILNDISEGPYVGEISSMGYPVVSIWHVDVVDFFNKMYLHGMLHPGRLTRAFDRLQANGLGWAFPRMLKLVFEKQRQAVGYSRLLVVPSREMARTIASCYGHWIMGKSDAFWAERILVLPWGGWSEEIPRSEIELEADALRRRYNIRPETRVLMTLSRLSPGKGHPLLLEALKILERRPDRPSDLCLFICGEPAFMRSGIYARRLRKAAESFKSFRIVFPGYLCPKMKQAFFRISNLFISPSVHESYGLSIVEAMRAGLPILASDHSGADELLTSEFSRIVPYRGQSGGWMSLSGRQGDIPVRIAQELSHLLADTENLKAMGRAALRSGENMSFAASAARLASEALRLIDSRAPVESKR